MGYALHLERLGVFESVCWYKLLGHKVKRARVREAILIVYLFSSKEYNCGILSLLQ